MDRNDIQMIPCFGFFLIANQDLSQVCISGCDNGTDWSTIHEGDRVRLILEDESLRFGAQNVLRGDLQGLFALLMNDLTTFRESEPFGKSESARMEEIRRFLADNLAAGLSALCGLFWTKRPLTRAVSVLSPCAAYGI